MTKSKVIVLLAEGFEEIEALTVVDILRRGGVDVVTAALRNGLEPVLGSRGISVVPDASLPKLSDAYGFDAVVLPGGLVGMQNLCADKAVLDLLRKMDDAGKIVAAICAAPIVLATAGVFRGRRFTCYPTCEAGLEGGLYTDEADVIVDGTLITSRGPATAMAFALKLLEAISGEEVAKRVSDGLLFHE